MIVLTQNKTDAVNFDLVEQLYITATYYPQIYADKGNWRILIGQYETEQQAIEIFQDLIEKWQGGGCSLYKMP